MLDITRYENKYHLTDGKFIDNWSETINLLPFNLNPSSSGFDKFCGLSGTTGEFFRKWGKVEVKAIQSFKEDVEGPVTAFLHESGKMKRVEQQQFIDVVKDILYPDGKMSVIEASFLPYLPLVEIAQKETRIGKKYIDGQKKIADYLYSMLINKEIPKELKKDSNLFIDSIRNGMARGRFANIREENKYYILPFIKEKFNEDITWLMTKEDHVIIKNIDFLLYFYACLSISQIIAHIAYWKEFDENDIIPFYYMLSSEHASATREVVEHGWEKWMSNNILQKLCARTQALDIFNTLAGEEAIGLYTQITKKLGSEPFEENKNICEQILERYHKEKYALLIKRSNITADDLYQNFDYSVSSYEEFFQKLTKLCIDFQSPDYNNRLEKKVRDLFEIKFLRNRRGLRVLAFDEDILIFLIAMFTKEERIKLDDMYQKFHSYGIFFDINTRTAIELQLTKLNLLDRKSDSGEAQYVRVIL